MGNKYCIVRLNAMPKSFEKEVKNWIFVTASVYSFKRVASRRDAFTHHCALFTQLFSKKKKKLTPGKELALLKGAFLHALFAHSLQSYVYVRYFIISQFHLHQISGKHPLITSSSGPSFPVLRRNPSALTPSQKENIIRKRASWSPAGLAGKTSIKTVSESRGNVHKRAPSDGAVRIAIEEKSLPNFPNGVDLLQFTPTSNSGGTNPTLNPYPDLLGMCDINSNSPIDSSQLTQSAIPLIVTSKPNPACPGASVSAPPTPNCEFPPSKIISYGEEPPALTKKKVRFRSPNSIQRQRSLLDLDMGEGQDIHNPLMQYNPGAFAQQTHPPPNDPPFLLDL